MIVEFSPDEHPVDFLSIGHICHDLTPGGKTVGGAAAYTASVAQALGCRSAVVTSANPEDDWQGFFPSISIHQKPSQATTVFENIYTPDGRKQTIHTIAGDISLNDIPEPWTRSPIVHLGPIANEVDPGLIRLFSNSVTGIGPQGWMRRWDKDGRIYHVKWESAADVVPLAAVTFLSLEDLADPRDLATYCSLAKTLVITDGPNGCTVYFHGEVRSFPAPVVEVLDTTGAGDIFAAAYLVRFYQTNGDVWESARFANQIAGHSVTAFGLNGKTLAIRQVIDGLLRPD
jgi:sugar/nucleoside kinase (ribokinase family)